MALILNQTIPLQMAYNALKSDKFHHSILVSGPQGVGKFESCLNITKSFFCKKKKNHFCDQCEDCIKVQLFQKKNVIIFSNDDRIPNIQFFRYLLKNKKTNIPKKISFFLVHEIKHLLYRHQMGFLQKLVKSKKSYVEGVKISAQNLEKITINTYKALNDFYLSAKAEILLEENLFLDLIKLQNCLDRTIMTKEGLIKAFAQTKVASKEKKILIIQNIHQLHFDIIPSVLKILEEPPANTQIFLITGDLKDIPKEVVKPLRSRCALLTFNHLNTRVCQKILKNKFGLDDEKIPKSLTNNLFDFFYLVEKETEEGLSKKLETQLENMMNQEKMSIIDFKDYLVEKEVSIEAVLLKCLFSIEKKMNSSLQWKQENQLRIFLNLLSDVKKSKLENHLISKNFYIKLFSAIKGIF